MLHEMQQRDHYPVDLVRMKIGYARVSTDDQDLTIQTQQLLADGCERIFGEKASGANAARPELGRLLEHIRAGDIVVVSRLDRLARSTTDLLALADRFKASGAGLRSIAEPWADTTSAAGTMVMTIFAGIAQFERSLILERTTTGRIAAQQRGVRFGRPPKHTPERIQMVMQSLAAGMSVAEVAKSFLVHEATVYRWKALHRRASDAAQLAPDGESSGEAANF